MRFLSLMEAKLPPGFRFQPRDEELVSDYLAKKVAGDDILNSFDYPTIVELDLNKIEPWDLPGSYLLSQTQTHFEIISDYSCL